MTAKYRIHPAIGMARVGESKDFYVGPEQAGTLPLSRDGSPFTEADFRDNQGALKRQGVRFRVFQITDDDAVGSPVVLGGDVTGIEWHVHIANKKSAWREFAPNEGGYGHSACLPLPNENAKSEDRKARFIDPGPRTLNAFNRNVSFDRHSIPAGYPGQFPTRLQPFGIDTLGDALLEEEGSLVVLGGHGRSGANMQPAYLTQYANWEGWYDDTSDGSVRAVLVMKDGRRVALDEHASVLCGPPARRPDLWEVYDGPDFEPRFYEGAFRIKQRSVNFERGLSLDVDFDLGLEPGDLTHYMAVPSQNDFNLCSGQWVDDRYSQWRPEQRPLDVGNREQSNQVGGWAGVIESQQDEWSNNT